MGYGTFESTHNNILESGRRLFLENGYERTNIRAICKDAGITHGSFYRHFDSKEALFGALVQPALDSFNALYDRSSDECLDMVETSQFEKTWNISEETSKAVVRLIYEHFNSFKLLLECADGTQYSNFLMSSLKWKSVALKKPSNSCKKEERLFEYYQRTNCTY